MKCSGIGRFHIAIAITCGYMFLAAGLENNLNAYILSSVHCDLQISSAQMGLLNAAFLVGESIISLFCFSRFIRLWKYLQQTKRLEFWNRGLRFNLPYSQLRLWRNLSRSYASRIKLKVDTFLSMLYSDELSDITL